MSKSTKYVDCVNRALASLDNHITESYENCKCTANLLLACFLSEIRSLYEESAEAAQMSHWPNILKRAHRSIRECPNRLYNVNQLGKLHGVGPGIVQIISHNLWKQHPPPPQTAEELELETRAAMLEEKLKVDARKQKALEKKKEKERLDALISSSTPSLPAGLSNVAFAAPMHPAFVPQQGAPAKELIASPPKPKVIKKRKAAAGSQPEAEAVDVEQPGPSSQEGKRVKKSAANKEYLPGLGTANYAFMVVLYVHHKTKPDVPCTKDALIKGSENSGLSNKPLVPNKDKGSWRPGQEGWYDGWSNFKRLLNNEPPLAIKYSNPAKLRLTEDGMVLGARLYADAVMRGLMAPHPSIPIAAQSPAAPALQIGAAAVEQEREACEQCTSSILAISPEAPAHQTGAGIVARVREAYEQCTSSVLAISPEAPARRTSVGTKAGALKVHDEVVDLLSSDESLPCKVVTPKPRRQSKGRKSAEFRAITTGVALHERADQELPALGQSSVVETAGAEAAGLRQRLSSAVGASTSAADLGTSAAAITLISPTKAAKKAPGPRPNRAPLPPKATITGARLKVLTNAQILDRQYVSDLISVPSVISGPQPSYSRASVSAGVMYSERNGGDAAPDQQEASVATSVSGSVRRGHTCVRDRGSWRIAMLGDKEEKLRLPPLPSGACFDDVYDVVLVLDQREQFSRCQGSSSLDSHLGSLTERGVKVVKRKLEKGDALWVARQKSDASVEYVLEFIVERKGVEDMASSIRDKRYEQQKYYLARCGLRRPLYLVEGNVEGLMPPVASKAVKTATAATHIQDGFTVLRTANVGETVRLYAAMTAAISRQYGPQRASNGDQGSAGNEGLPKFQDFQSRMKAMMDGITLRDLWGLMLSSLPKLGQQCVDAILAEYPTPASLWRAYQKAMSSAQAEGREPQAAARGLLAHLRSREGGRTVGLQASHKVYDSLFAA